MAVALKRTYPRGPRIERSGRGGRFYLWQRETYWSVTTIISGGIPKPVLVNWAKKVTAEAAVNHIDLLTKMVEDDPKGALDWLKRAPDRQRDTAGDIGTAVHKAAEAYVLGKPYPEWADAEKPYMEQFVMWLEKFQPKIIAAEAPVFSRKERYAGTLDTLVEFDRDDVRLMYGIKDRPVRLILDYKSGKGVYPEVGLQLAAYRYAESFLGMPDGSEAPMPKVDGGAVVHVRPGGCKFIPIRCDEEIFNTFLFAREIFRFAEELAETVVGPAWEILEGEPEPAPWNTVIE